MYFGKNILKTIMLKKQKYVFLEEHIQNNNVNKQKYVIQNNNAKKIEICIFWS